jgi:ATP-dependent protease ClpP protease subunit
MDKSESLTRLLTKRIVPIVGEITSETSKRVKLDLLELALQSLDDSVTLVIDSRGGCSQAAIEVYDFIKLNRINAVGVVYGKCMSSAVTILMACKKRVCTPHAIFLLHFVSRHSASFTPNPKRIEEARDWFETLLTETLKQTEYMVQIIACATGLRIEQVLDLIERGHVFNEELDPNQAKQLGLVHEIVESMDLLH